MATDFFAWTEMVAAQSSKEVTFNEALQDIEDAIISGIFRLGSAVCDMQNGDGKSNIFTVPAGRKAIITHIVVRGPTASLAGGTDFDFGDGADADTWVNAVDLSGLTASTDYYVVEGNNTKYTIFDAADIIGVKPVTGATADAQATIDVFGYIYDA